jgi:hypothetical protein
MKILSGKSPTRTSSRLHYGIQYELVLLAEAGRRECESAADVLSSETAESMVGQRSRGCALLHAAAFADSQDPGCKRPVQITAGKPLVNATTAPRALP